MLYIRPGWGLYLLLALIPFQLLHSLFRQRVHLVGGSIADQVLQQTTRVM